MEELVLKTIFIFKEREKMKTEAVKFKDTYKNDVVVIRGDLYFVRKRNITGESYILGLSLNEEAPVERVITQGPLTRLKRYLVG